MIYTMILKWAAKHWQEIAIGLTVAALLMFVGSLHIRAERAELRANKAEHQAEMLHGLAERAGRASWRRSLPWPMPLRRNGRSDGIQVSSV